MQSLQWSELNTIIFGCPYYCLSDHKLSTIVWNCFVIQCNNRKKVVECICIMHQACLSYEDKFAKGEILMIYDSYNVQ